MDVTFNEKDMPFKVTSEESNLEPKTPCTESYVEVELPFLTKLTSKGVDSHEDHHLAQEDLDNEPPTQEYLLARDRHRRTIKPFEKYGYADLIFCAFAVGSDLEINESSTYREAIRSKDRE